MNLQPETVGRPMRLLSIWSPLVLVILTNVGFLGIKLCEREFNIPERPRSPDLHPPVAYRQSLLGRNLQLPPFVLRTALNKPLRPQNVISHSPCLVPRVFSAVMYS